MDVTNGNILTVEGKILEAGLGIYSYQTKFAMAGTKCLTVDVDNQLFYIIRTTGTLDVVSILTLETITSISLEPFGFSVAEGLSGASAVHHFSCLEYDNYRKDRLYFANGANQTIYVLSTEDFSTITTVSCSYLFMSQIDSLREKNSSTLSEKHLFIGHTEYSAAANGGIIRVDLETFAISYLQITSNPTAGGIAVAFNSDKNILVVMSATATLSGGVTKYINPELLTTINDNVIFSFTNASQDLSSCYLPTVKVILVNSRMYQNYNISYLSTVYNVSSKSVLDQVLNNSDFVSSNYNSPFNNIAVNDKFLYLVSTDKIEVYKLS